VCSSDLPPIFQTVQPQRAPRAGSLVAEAHFERPLVSLDSERALAAYKAASQPPPTAECTPRDLDAAARAGCAIANQLWEAFGTELGAALANIVWLLNPDVIVIGGGVAKAADVLFPHISRSVRSRCSDVVTEHLRIVAATLGNDAGAIGCGALALEAAQARL
jgi:glucokinase